MALVSWMRSYRNKDKNKIIADCKEVFDQALLQIKSSTIDVAQLEVIKRGT